MILPQKKYMFCFLARLKSIAYALGRLIRFEDIVILGPPAFGRRYVPQLAVRSALRRQSLLGLAYGHCCTSLGQYRCRCLITVFQCKTLH